MWGHMEDANISQLTMEVELVAEDLYDKVAELAGEGSIESADARQRLWDLYELLDGLVYRGLLRQSAASFGISERPAKEEVEISGWLVQKT